MSATTTTTTSPTIAAPPAAAVPATGTTQHTLLARTSKLKHKLTQLLGKDGPAYWSSIVAYLTGRIMRWELDALIEQYVPTKEALALHNAFLLSVLRTASASSAPSDQSDPSDSSQLKAGRKRKHVYPYQGAAAEDDTGVRSKRIKEWVVGMGRAERERLKGVAAAPSAADALYSGEINREIGVHYVPDVPIAGIPPLPQLLCTTTKTLPTATTLHQRMTRLAVQRGLANGISATCVPLLTAALDAHLKTLTTRALTLSRPSLPFASIRPALPSAPHLQPALRLPDFRSVLTLSPSEIPNKSASVVQLVGYTEPGAVGGGKGAEGREEGRKQWEMLLRVQRSGVREELGVGKEEEAADGRAGWEEVDRVGEWIAAVV